MIAFNGEIYNFQSLKNQFLKITLSLKEVLIQKFYFVVIHYGIENSLAYKWHVCFCFMGHKDKILYLARDRMGEKPLYYGWQNNAFIFASELKAIQKFPFFKNQLSRKAISLQLKYSNVPAPFSIFENIYKLMPASFLTINLSSNEIKNKTTKPKKYWFPNFQEKKQAFKNNPIKDLEKLLVKTVKRQLISDVSLGVFLSGGIDSSLIASISQANNRKINSFSIGFNEQEFNEVNVSRKTSNYLNTDHNELIVTDKDTINIYQIFQLFMMSLFLILLRFQH